MNKSRALSISLLIAYIVGMIGLALSGKTLLNVPGLSLYELLNETRIARWAGLAALQIAIAAGRFVPIGFFVPYLFPNVRGRLAELALRLFGAFPLAILFTAIVRGFEFGPGWQLAGPIDLLLPSLGCAFGIFLGSNWKRGWKARYWLIPKLAVGFLALAGCLVLFFVYGTDTEAMEFSTATVTSQEKQLVWGKISQARNAAKKVSDAPTNLRLDSHDLTVLLNWGFSLFPHEIKSRADLGYGTVSTQVTMKLPGVQGHNRFFNLAASCRANAALGNFDLQITGVQLGQITFPEWLLRVSSYLGRSFVRNDRRTRDVLDATERMELTPEEAVIVYREADLSKTQLAKLFGGGTSDELVESSRAQIEYLIAHSSGIRSAPKDEKVVTALRTAFQLAKLRSADHDPVTENKAAVIALNLAWGDQAMARFTGEIADEKKRRALREALGPVEIRDKTNWAENFFLAGAITVTSSQGMADAASILKEELDKRAEADRQQRFSFGDLLSRRAGVRFADVATRENKSARTLQDRIAAGIRLDDFFPKAEGLPDELVGGAEIVTSGGKAHGKVFDEYMKDIERRLDKCRLYQTE